MITFSIDGMPKSKDYNLAMDYNSKVVYSAACDPLFKYSKKDNKYICNACEKYSIDKKYKRYVITLRNDLYYSNGEKVSSIDYKKAILKVAENNVVLSNYFKNILEIKCLNNQLIIILNKADKFFVNKLSMYQISPSKNGLTSGLYVLYSYNHKEIKLIPNKYYRNPTINNLQFLITSNELEHVKNFENGKINITNNTLYPIGYKNKNGNFNIEDSYIIYNIEISSKIPVIIRKNIVNSINKNYIAHILGGAKPIDFFETNKSNNKTHIINKIEYQKEIVIGYNNFYPNYIVANCIRDNLLKNNFNVKLVEYDYDKIGKNFINKYDINLVLNYFEFYDVLYFYESLYFEKIMKSNIIYKILIDLYKNTGKKFLLNSIYGLFRNKYLKESLVMIKNLYLTDKYTNDFSFVELNYEIIANKKEKNYD